MIIDKYSNELSEMIRILSSIKTLNFSSINVYGSAFNEEMFVEGVSDIDVIVMCKDFQKFNLLEIKKEIDNMDLNFNQKRPIIIKDSLCERIEFYIAFDNITIDVTISPGLIPNYTSLEKDAWYDGFEALMGGVYLNSKCIYGEIPDYNAFINEYYPFYSETLREKRLNILSERIQTYNDRIRIYLENNSPELVDHLYKVKKFFIKFLFIYYRKYYWTPEKHTYYQLTKFLNLSNEEKNILCFLNGDLFSSAKEFLELSDSYLKKYKQETIIDSKIKRLKR